MSIYKFAAIAVLLWNTTGFAFGQKESTALKERFIAEIGKLQSPESANLEFRAKVKTSIKVANEKPKVREYTMALNGPNAKEESFTKKTELHKVRNSDYAFGVNVSSTGKRAELVFLESLSSREANRIIEKHFGASEGLKAILMGTSISGKSIKDFVGSPGFSLKSINPIGPETDGLIKVEFDFISGDDVAFPFRLSKSYFVCDSKHFWFIVEYDLNESSKKDDSKTHYHGNLVSTKSSNGVPLAETVKMTVKEGDGLFFLSETTSDITVEKVDVGEFRLRHYGLPEPKFGRSSFYWLIGITFGVLLLAASIWIKKKGMGYRDATH